MTHKHKPVTAQPDKYQQVTDLLGQAAHYLLGSPSFESLDMTTKKLHRARLVVKEGALPESQSVMLKEMINAYMLDNAVAHAEFGRIGESVALALESRHTPHRDGIMFPDHERAYCMATDLVMKAQLSRADKKYFLTKIAGEFFAPAPAGDDFGRVFDTTEKQKRAKDYLDDVRFARVEDGLYFDGAVDRTAHYLRRIGIEQAYGSLTNRPDFSVIDNARPSPHGKQSQEKREPK